MQTRILFLAAQVQPFLSSGLRILLTNYDVEIWVVCQNESESAPVSLMSHPKLRVFKYDYEPDSLLWKDIEAFSPDIVFCAGWMQLRYLSWCKLLKNKGATTICAFDTQWKGTFKQKVLVKLAPFTIQKYFTNAWIPGKRQLDYAQLLGFSESQIALNLYAPDSDLFGQAYQNFCASSLKKFPKLFLYVGRLEPHKLKNLLLAFHTLRPHERKDWRLEVIGNGSMFKDKLLQHVAIEYKHFLAQQDLINIAAQSGVFCLCSTDEPWGTVIQEFASAGMPLIVSEQCGAQPHFLIEGENGFLCDGNNIASIAAAFKKIIATDDATLFAMGTKSNSLGIVTNSATWAEILMSIKKPN
jgi:glycosyltransferase involved in cell wall biosynthesis